MTDPFDALREPVVPVSPDPGFAARLREELARAVLQPIEQGEAMAVQLTRHEPAWPPTITPYLVVSDARAALDWYVEVFGAEQRGEMYVDEDGAVGHAEVGIGDAVLMFSESSDLYPEVPVSAPDSPTTFSQSVRIEVPDVDSTVALARRRGAVVEREPVTQPYGRGGVIVDPFGHRWLVATPPARATRYRQGDVANVTMVTPDAGRAKNFYEAVLQVPFAAASVANSWNAQGTNPRFGMWSPEGEAAQVQLAFRVDDATAAAERVRTAGGQAEAVERHPYGLMVECTDDQGMRFQLWQPVD